MNGRTFLSIFFIGSIFSVSNLIAQDLSGLKVGVVNVGRLLQESPQAVAATQSLEDEFAPRRREFLALQSAYEAKAAQLEQDRDVMGVSERENVQRDLRDDQRELLRTQNELGTWWEDEFTGTGFPVHFFIKYHMYQHFFPLMALGRYRKAIENG